MAQILSMVLSWLVLGEIMKKPPPTDCKVCGEPNCNDWMYKVGLVKAENAICGKCKQRIGKEILEKMDETISDLIKKGRLK